MQIFEKAAFFRMTVKKKYHPQIGLNQKTLLYKLERTYFLTICIEGIFDLAQIKDGIFFLRKK